VLRGGSWNNNAENCRAAYRNRNAPGNRNNNYGLRVCFRLHGHRNAWTGAQNGRAIYPDRRGDWAPCHGGRKKSGAGTV
jgi:hypothetical protein